MYLRERMCAKLHNGVVTQANKDYEGSVTIGKKLLEASGIFPFDKVQVLNITNGNRIETYVIEGEGNELCLNGAAANLFDKGDHIIIIAYLYIMIGRLSNGGLATAVSGINDIPPVKIVILDGTENNNIKYIKE